MAEKKFGLGFQVRTPEMAEKKFQVRTPEMAEKTTRKIYILWQQILKF